MTHADRTLRILEDGIQHLPWKASRSCPSTSPITSYYLINDDGYVHVEIPWASGGSAFTECPNLAQKIDELPTSGQFAEF
jgi:hypothetical protein